MVGLRGKVAETLADLPHRLAVLQLQLADQPVPATTSIEKQFQGGLVFKARRLLYHSTLGRE